MAYDFTETVTIGNGIKQEFTKLVKLTFADFVTGGTASVKEVLPADATITGFKYWKKTAFSGGSVSAVSLGIASGATTYVTALDLHTPTAGATALIPATNIFQQASGSRTDIPLTFTGTATTGNPTAGEVYIQITYVR